MKTTYKQNLHTCFFDDLAIGQTFIYADCDNVEEQFIYMKCENACEELNSVCINDCEGLYGASAHDRVIAVECELIVGV